MEFKLRLWQLSDVESLAKHANNKAIANNLTDTFPHPYSEEDAKKYINFASSSEPQTLFAITIEGQACGAVGLYPQKDIYSKNAELGYWLSEAYWGKGIVTEAVKEITVYGFKTLDIDRIYARPFGTNIGSQKVLEKAGYNFEAKLEKTIYKNGRYEDELIYAFRKKDLK